MNPNNTSHWRAEHTLMVVGLVLILLPLGFVVGFSDRVEAAGLYLRIVASLGGALVGASIPGLLHINFPGVRATGALAILALLWLSNPPQAFNKLAVATQDSTARFNPPLDGTAAPVATPVYTPYATAAPVATPAHTPYGTATPVVTRGHTRYSTAAPVATRSHTRYESSEGYFEKIGAKWVEYKFKDGGPQLFATFQESKRDRQHVYLADPSRSETDTLIVRLPLEGGVAQFAWASAPERWIPLFVVKPAK